LENAGKLIFNVNCLKKEYKQNVQSYTYDRFVQGLSENNMTIENETVLEDDSILLTINVAE